MAPQAIEIAQNGLRRLATSQSLEENDQANSLRQKGALWISKKLRESALKPLKSLARVNLCAGARLP